MNKKQLEKSRIRWRLFGVSMIIFCIIFDILAGLDSKESYKQGFQDGQADGQANCIRVNIKNFTETLELINNNCGSVFFTKQYGQNYFTIFVQSCLEGGFCKSSYKTIEECVRK